MGTPPHSARPPPDTVPVTHLDEIDSTNTEAMRRARRGERGPLWLVARRQTDGRGRLGRRWESPPGNLYCSLLLDLDCPPESPQQLSLVAAVAAYEAVLRLTGDGARLRLKWPNDVLLDGAKIGGILVESTNMGARRVAVIGVGINLVSAPSGTGREVTHLAAHGADVAPEAALAGLQSELQRWLAAWQHGSNFAQIRAAWVARAGPAGQPISVDIGSGRILGTYLGLDESGGLLMRDVDGKDRRFAFGEVRLLGGPGHG